VVGDSQKDSQAGGRLRMQADHYGLRMGGIEFVRTLTDERGRWLRGLQNRLRGAVEALGKMGGVRVGRSKCITSTTDRD
jgi:hypothetical protein